MTLIKTDERVKSEIFLIEIYRNNPMVNNDKSSQIRYIYNFRVPNKSTIINYRQLMI